MARAWRKTEPKGEYGPGLRATLAYLVSCIFAACFLTISYASIGFWTEQTIFITSVVEAVATAIFAVFYIFILTIIPVIVFVSMARHFSWRRGWADAIAGGFLGLLLSIFIMVSAVPALNTIEFLLFAIYTFTGAMSGLIYWLLAGRPCASPAFQNR